MAATHVQTSYSTSSSSNKNSDQVFNVPISRGGGFFNDSRFADSRDHYHDAIKNVLHKWDQNSSSSFFKDENLGDDEMDSLIQQRRAKRQLEREERRKKFNEYFDKWGDDLEIFGDQSNYMSSSDSRNKGRSATNMENSGDNKCWSSQQSSQTSENFQTGDGGVGQTQKSFKSFQSFQSSSSKAGNNLGDSDRNSDDLRKSSFQSSNFSQKSSNANDKYTEDEDDFDLKRKNMKDRINNIVDGWERDDTFDSRTSHSTSTSNTKSSQDFRDKSKDASHKFFEEHAGFDREEGRNKSGKDFESFDDVWDKFDKSTTERFTNIGRDWDGKTRETSDAGSDKWSKYFDEEKGQNSKSWKEFDEDVPKKPSKSKVRWGPDQVEELIDDFSKYRNLRKDNQSEDSCAANIKEDDRCHKVLLLFLFKFVEINIDFRI